jgi:hypothetical protein
MIPKKPVLGLDPRMGTGFRIRSCANKILDRDPIQLNWIAVQAALKEEFMRPSFAVLIGMALLAVPTASAQDSPAGPPLGEIMTLQQLRHIKLWFAGRAGNWPLADYEMGELNEGFEDVNKLLGGDTVDKAVGAPMQALQKIIDNKDRAAFTAAFDQLTAGCNSCHHTLDHGFIAIQRPTSLPYSNQNFAPQK